MEEKVLCSAGCLGIPFAAFTEEIGGVCAMCDPFVWGLHVWTV